MLDNRFKIILIVCIIFIIAVTGSYAFFSFNNTPKVNNSTNENITVQNSSDSTSIT